MGKWTAASFCVPILSLYGAEAYERRGPVQMGDFKIFGSGGGKLVSDIRKAIGVDNGELNGLEENLPTPPEASILSGASAVEVEPESMLEMDDGDDTFEADDEAEEESLFGDDDDEEEEAEASFSFLEGHSGHEDLEDSEDSEMYGGESEDDAEEEEDEQISFLEGQAEPEDAEDFEEDAATWDEDEEDSEMEDAAVDPYPTGDSALHGLSYVEEAAEAVDEEDDESAVEAEEEADEEQPEEEADASFLENAEDEEEEDAMAGSFIQLASTRDIHAHNHVKEASSFVDSALSHETTDQTAAEDEMLREAGSPPDENESEAGPIDSPVDEDMAEAGNGNDFSDEGLASRASPTDEQADEAYRGPADPVIKYGGNANEDVEPDDIENATPSGDANGPESLRARAEEAGAEQEEMPAITEEELASDLQGSFPRIEAARPHVVQRRHVEQDIKMTEALRTEGTGEKASSGSSPASFTALTIACTGLAFLWL